LGQIIKSWFGCLLFQKLLNNLSSVKFTTGRYLLIVNCVVSWPKLGKVTQCTKSCLPVYVVSVYLWVMGLMCAGSPYYTGRLVSNQVTR
jgi:hypothetical protein